MGYTSIDGALRNWFCVLFYSKNIEMIDSRLKRFILKIVVAALAMTLLATILFKYFIPEHFIPILPWKLIFFTVITILIHWYQLTLLRKNLVAFVRSSMIISIIRLLLYSSFAIGYFIIDGENAPVFIVSLVIIYLVYTFLEIRDTTRIVQKKS